MNTLKRSFAYLLPLWFSFFFFSSLGEAFVQVQEITTPQGIRVWVQEDRTTPVIALAFAFDGGALQDPRGKEGVATLLAHMLMEGTSSKTAEQLSEFLQDWSISLGYEVDADLFSGGMVTLRENMEKAFDLVRETFFDSVFPEENFQRVRDQHLAVLATKSHDPGYQLSRHLSGLIYKDHPYARPVLGTAASVKNIRVEDLKAFTHLLSRKGLKVVLAGPISAKESADIVDSLFAALPKESPSPPVEPVSLNLKKAKEVIREKIPQTSFAFVQKGLHPQQEDFLDLVFLNRILSQRLWLTIREEKGLAYSIVSTPEVNRQVGLFWGFCGTKNEGAFKAAEEVTKIFQDLQKNGFTDQEYEDAQAYLIGSYVLNFQDTPGIAKALLGLMKIGKPSDYIQKRNTLLRALHKDRLTAFTQKFLTPETLFFVFYGDPEGFPQ